MSNEPPPPKAHVQVLLERVEALKEELERLKTERPAGWQEQCVLVKRDLDEELFDLQVLSS
jgi:hypothetical protein